MESRSTVPSQRPRRLPSRWAGGVLASVLVLSGCSLMTSDDDVRVLVVGDSVTVLSEDALRAELDWADTIDVRATNGLRTDELLDGARAGAEDNPDFGIFMPGYNDVMQERVDNPALEEMMGLASELPCAVWLLLPADGGLVADQAEIWNQRVRDLADPHETVHVSDGWKRLVETTPEFTFVSEADAVHPNAEGRKALASVMTAEAEKHCR